MAAKDKLDEFITQTIRQETLEDIIGERFGRYSKYIIQDRAIPDVRDGLKPVQRRILYAMYLLRMFSNSPFKKSARICGEVMGKFHPHGDSSIYEALVRMSQTWKMGVTLIEMHGNNGSIDGDSPAAMRYTETRLSKNSEYMLADIDKKTVNFAPNFDDEELEPTVLPARFPNILVNGATGISAGYATNIPPHNLSEVIDATIHMIDHPNMNIDDLLEIMHGPDFPTGGIVQGIKGIRDAFETGRGKVIVRSKTHFEDITKDGQKRIVATEIPYEVNKGNLVKKIDQLRLDKVVEDIVEVRDESDREGLRIAIDLRKGANHEAILTYLFKNTDLQVSYSYNMVAICNRRPMTLGVLDILKAYVEHQKEIVTNRSNFELDKAKKRIHILEGLIHMVDVLEDVIRIIRASKGKADAKTNIMNAFGFTELQAEAIVTLQLYRLSSTDVNALIAEKGELDEKVAYLENILSNEKELLKVIKTELREIKNVIGKPRLSVIEEEVAELKVDETHLIPKEDVMCCVTKDGYIKRSSQKSYQASVKNGIKEGDAVIFSGMVNTLDTLLVFTSQGNYFFIPVYKIADYKWKDLGDHLSSIDSLDKSKNERVISVMVVSDFTQPVNMLFCTKEGLIKQVMLSDLEVSRYSKSIRYMKVANGDEVVSVDSSNNPLEVVVVTHNAEVLRFRASEVSVYGTNASGIKAMLVKPKDYVVSAFFTNQTEDILFFTSRSYVKRMKVTEFNLSRRARAGAIAIKMIKANPHYVVDAKPLTPTQYRENVKANLIYNNGNQYEETYQFKYNVSDAGKGIEKNEGLTEPYMLFIEKANGKEPVISGEYLVEIKPVQTSIFDSTIEGTSYEEITTESILSSLDEILALENEAQNQPPKTIVVTNERGKIVENKKEETPSTIVFKKVNLFGEEE